MSLLVSTTLHGVVVESASGAQRIATTHAAIVGMVEAVEAMIVARAHAAPSRAEPRIVLRCYDPRIGILTLTRSENDPDHIALSHFPESLRGACTRLDLPSATGYPFGDEDLGSCLAIARMTRDLLEALMRAESARRHDAVDAACRLLEAGGEVENSHEVLRLATPWTSLCSFPVMEDEILNRLDSILPISLALNVVSDDPELTSVEMVPVDLVVPTRPDAVSAMRALSDIAASPVAARPEPCAFWRTAA